MKNREKVIKELLEDCYWVQTLTSQRIYSRQHDDTDGETNGHLMVQFSVDGDAWVNVDNQRPVLRFRMPMTGGGHSHRTRNALMILAEAIRLDNEEEGK